MNTPSQELPKILPDLIRSTPLVSAALRLGIEPHPFENAEQFRDRVRKLAPDLFRAAQEKGLDGADHIHEELLALNRAIQAFNKARGVKTPFLGPDQYTIRALFRISQIKVLPDDDGASFAKRVERARPGILSWVDEDPEKMTFVLDSALRDFRKSSKENRVRLLQLFLMSVFTLMIVTSIHAGWIKGENTSLAMVLIYGGLFFNFVAVYYALRLRWNTYRCENGMPLF